MCNNKLFEYICNIVFADPEFCEVQSVGLVHYPKTLAPDSGSTIVTAQCADNARRVSSSLSVTCSSTGSCTVKNGVLNNTPNLRHQWKGCSVTPVKCSPTPVRCLLTLLECYKITLTPCG